MFYNFETLLGRPRCISWIPLATQQLRLRHLIQIIGYNIKIRGGSFYYTLHLTTMSSPFYSSEKLESTNPKWAEIDISALQNSSASGVVLRIWHHNPSEKCPDNIILTWVIYFSGLVYLGTKLSDIQPVSFNDDAVIFQLNGGYFTNINCLRTDCSKPLPFIDNLNVLSDGDTTKITRIARVKCVKNDVRISYNTNKLQRLHSLQQSIKNKTLDAQVLREKISVKCGLLESCDGSEGTESPPAPAQIYQNSPHLLSMNSLHKLLNKQEQKPSRIERQEIAKIKKLIETARFRTKVLSQERDRKLANLRHLNEKCNTLIETNDDMSTELMSRYMQLSKEVEKLREFRRSQADIRELYVHMLAQLNLCRKQLIHQLLLIYPIEKMASSDKYTISGIHLPDSECLNVAPERDLSVALGYVSHLVIMCSIFLQVPLRYPIVHLSSRSRVVDHITVNIPDKEREFPLYTRGKDRLQFHYAVYLLNKNIAQLRWYYNIPTADLRATLPNLLTFLQGNSDYRYDRPDSSLTNRMLSTTQRKLSLSLISSVDKMLATNNNQLNGSSQTKESPARKVLRNSDSGPGLSQILSSGNYFKISSPPREKSCVDCIIEQVDSDAVCKSQNEHSKPKSEPLDVATKLLRRVSRSVGSYTDEEKSVLGSSNVEVGSDPVFTMLALDKPEGNTSDQSLPESLSDGRKEFLQHWFENSPSLVCSNENLCEEAVDKVGSASAIAGEEALTDRTEALVGNSSFHLVRPKH